MKCGRQREPERRKHWRQNEQRNVTQTTNLQRQKEKEKKEEGHFAEGRAKAPWFVSNKLLQLFP